MSRAAGSVSPTTPLFEAAYATWPICPSQAAIEAVLTHTPRSPSPSGSLPAIAAQARRRTLNVPIRLTLMTLWKTSRSWGPCLAAIRCAQPMPAQHTEIRSPPSAPAAASTAACTGSGSITLASTKRARSPSSDASASPFSALRSAITTDAPRSCRARAVAAPSPEAPPATSAPCPSIRIGAAA